MHPLVTDIKSLKNSELDAKVSDLTKKYFMTSNAHLQAQIAAMLDVYKEELAFRQYDEWQRATESRIKGLDKLINVS